MRLVTFSDSNGMRIGVHDSASATIVDLAAVSRLPKDMTSFIALGKNGLKRARAAVKSGEGRLAFDSVKLHAPIPRPAKNVLCVGKNYYDHAKEFHNSGFDASAGKDAIPELPIIFTKWPNSVIAHGEPIPSYLDYTNSTDYEATIWLGIMAPAGTPKPIVDRLNAEIGKIVARPDVKKAWNEQGAEPMAMTPAEFEKFLNADIAKWAHVVKVAGVKPD